MKKRKGNILVILLIFILVFFILNYARILLTNFHIQRAISVEDRFEKKKQRTLIIDDGTQIKKYVRNLNNYMLEIKSKPKADEEHSEENLDELGYLTKTYYYDAKEDKGYAKIDGKITEISEENLYLNLTNEEKKSGENIENEKQVLEESKVKVEEVEKETAEKIEKNEAKDESEVEKIETTEEQMNLEAEVKIPEKKVTFVEYFDTSRILKEFQEDIFLTLYNKDEKYINLNSFNKKAKFDIETMYLVEFSEKVGEEVLEYKFNFLVDGSSETFEMPKM